MNEVKIHYDYLLRRIEYAEQRENYYSQTIPNWIFKGSMWAITIIIIFGNGLAQMIAITFFAMAILCSLVHLGKVKDFWLKTLIFQRKRFDAAELALLEHRSLKTTATESVAVSDESYFKVSFLFFILGMYAWLYNLFSNLS